MAAFGRQSEAPQPDPIAYFLTWPTYGTWLPGDDRGWVEYRRGWRLPDPARKLEAEASMTEDACTLDPEQRRLVEATITEHCRIRNWVLYAVNCRTNHLHVVVAAPLHPDEVRDQLKAWCTRRLKELEESRMNTNPTRQRGRIGTRNGNAKRPQGIRTKWWAERGSKRYINDPNSLEAAIRYVREGQDH